MDDLTKTQQYHLSLIYNEYLSRIKNGSDISNAKLFETSFFNSLSSSGINKNDFMHSLSALKRKKYIKLFVTGAFVLEDKGIIVLENKFSNGLSEVVDFISKFI